MGEAYRSAHEPSLAIQRHLDAEIPIAIGCPCRDLVPIETRKAALSIGNGRRCQAIINSASQRHKALGSLTAPAAPIISATTARYYQREKDQKNGKIYYFQM